MMDVFPSRELKMFYSIPDGELFQMRMRGRLIFAINATKKGAGGTTSKVTICLQDSRSSDLKPALSYVEFEIEDQWVVSYGSDYIFQSNIKSGVVDLAGHNNAERSGALILRAAGPALRIPPAPGTHYWHDIEYDIMEKTIANHTDVQDLAVVRPFSLCLRRTLTNELEELLTFP